MARILLVDDDEGFRTAVAELLSLEGHEVVQAADGAEASDIYRAGEYDVVVTDLMMPRKDGVMLIQELVADFPGVKLVAISGGPGGAPAWLPFVKSIGALRVLKKPFAREKLLEAVKEVLGN